MLGAITGGIAEAFCGGVPDPVRAEVEERLAPDHRKIVARFYSVYG